jgi:hypothetical protein
MISGSAFRFCFPLPLSGSAFRFCFRFPLPLSTSAIRFPHKRKAESGKQKVESVSGKHKQKAKGESGN